MEHLIIEYNEKYNFNKVTCPEGHYITKWDGEDYLNYTASTIMYTPANMVLDNYYCVTEEEHNANMEKHRLAMEAKIIKDIEERENNINISGTTE